MPDENKARVFISCGQTRNTEEEHIASDIKRALENEGFWEPYVAINEQTTSGFRENILSKLEQAEYFIFIDFKREVLLERKRGIIAHIFKQRNKRCRGSLFSNQELAIAISQDKRIIALQEDAIKERDGFLSVTQVNPITFHSRERIVETVIEKVQESGWDPNWQDEINIHRENDDWTDALYGGQIPPFPARFFHIRASNRNKYKVARNCVCYLTKIIQRPENVVRVPQLVEIKWKIIKQTDTDIPPNGYRKFDAFFVKRERPDRIHLGYNRNNIDYLDIENEYQLPIPGQYDVFYEIYSDNFRLAKATFRFSLNTDFNAFEINKIE